MRNTLLILLLSVSASLSGQTTELHLNEDYSYKNPLLCRVYWWVWGWDLRTNIPDGEYVVYNDSTHTTKYLEGKQIGGKREGVWTYYHINGLVHFKIPYLDGDITDTLLEFSYAGDTINKAYFKNGKCYCSIKFRTPWSWEPPSTYPEYIMTSHNKIAVTTYYDRDGSIHEVDSHDYRTNMRHDCFYNEDGKLSREFFDAINGSHSGGTSVSHNYAYNPDSVRDLSVNLKKPEDWLKLDSISFFPRLRHVYIEWYPDVDLTKVDIDKLDQRLRPLKQCSELRTLTIHLDGPIPGSVYSLTQLTELSIFSNTSMDKRIGHLKNLEILQYWYRWKYANPHDSTLTIPRSIRHLKKLYRLELTTYQMADPNKELLHLLPVKSLRVLVLMHNGFSEFPESLTRLSQLHTLYIAGGDGSWNLASDFTTVPSSLSRMQNLRYLTVPINVNDTCLKPWIKKLPLCLMSVESICFTAETDITMGDGTTKPIDMIQVGDIVLSYNMKESKTDTALVTHIMIHHVPETDLVILQTAHGKEIHVTPNHPIWTSDNGYMPASMITPQSKLMSISTGEIATENALRCTNRMLVANTVYNVGTTKNNYFANGILVHNK